MSTAADARDPAFRDSGERDWLSDLASGLDPRVRAAIDVSGPGSAEGGLSEEVCAVMDAAVRELLESSGTSRGGVAPVLGAGVVAGFLRTRAKPANGDSDSEGSRIDERR